MDNGTAATITLIAFGLAMDCFAVSITRGVETKKDRAKTALLIAFSFGFFQAIMPLIGWFLGERFIEFVGVFDHWIAFLLLALIGLKMIKESREEKKEDIKPLDMPVLLTLSFATSIDALAAGLTIAFLDMSIYLAAVIIGAASFIMSVLGFYLGKKAGNRFGSRMELVGGLILFGIGLKILLEHLLL